MPAHAGMRARRRWRRPAGRPAPVPGRAWVWVWVRVPYPAWFFLNPVCSAPLPKPPARQRIRTARQRMSENRLGGWTVVRFGQLGGWTERLRRFCPNRRNC